MLISEFIHSFLKDLLDNLFVISIFLFHWGWGGFCLSSINLVWNFNEILFIWSSFNFILSIINAWVFFFFLLKKSEYFFSKYQLVCVTLNPYSLPHSYWVAYLNIHTILQFRCFLPTCVTSTCSHREIAQISLSCITSRTQLLAH